MNLRPKLRRRRPENAATSSGQPSLKTADAFPRSAAIMAALEIFSIAVRIGAYLELRERTHGVACEARISEDSLRGRTTLRVRGNGDTSQNQSKESGDYYYSTKPLSETRIVSDNARDAHSGEATLPFQVRSGSLNCCE